MIIDPILVDVYSGDLNGRPRWDILVNSGLPYCGALLKVSEGGWTGGQWFHDNWQAVRAEATRAWRYGVNFWRGGYHYLRFGVDAKSQAQLFHSTIEKAGGWDVGDLWPVVDVESANNPGATKEKVEDSVGAFVEESKRIHGREVLLYGGSLLAELGITSHMGCKALITARYTPTLPVHVVNRIGWKLDELFGWQFCGVDGKGKPESYLEGYPIVTPMGAVDLTAIVIDGGGDKALEWIRSHMWPEQP